MNEQQRIAYVQAMVACAMIEMAGMQAENQQRAHRGESLAYVGDDFNKVIDKYGIHHNAVIMELLGR